MLLCFYASILLCFSASIFKFHLWFSFSNLTFKLQLQPITQPQFQLLTPSPGQGWVWPSSAPACVWVCSAVPLIEFRSWFFFLTTNTFNRGCCSRSNIFPRRRLHFKDFFWQIFQTCFSIFIDQMRVLWGFEVLLDLIFEKQNDHLIRYFKWA